MQAHRFYKLLFAHRILHTLLCNVNFKTYRHVTQFNPIRQRNRRKLQIVSKMACRITRSGNNVKKNAMKTFEIKPNEYGYQAIRRTLHETSNYLWSMRECMKAYDNWSEMITAHEIVTQICHMLDALEESLDIDKG